MEGSRGHGASVWMEPTRGKADFGKDLSHLLERKNRRLEAQSNQYLMCTKHRRCIRVSYLNHPIGVVDSIFLDEETEAHRDWAKCSS